jgi:hypothetical protein
MGSWLGQNWPWLLLVAGLTIVVVSQRQFIGRAFGGIPPIPARNRKTRPEKKAPPQVEEETLPGVTIIRSSPVTQKMENAQETIVFHREMEAVISSANDHLVEEWLRKQDSEQIGNILSNEVSARLLITGFGSFGGSSLVRGVTAKLIDNYVRRGLGKVLVIRLETPPGALEGQYQLFINENRAGAVDHAVPQGQLTPMVQGALTGQANAANPQADDSHNTFAGLTMAFAQENSGVEEPVRGRAVAALVQRLLTLINAEADNAALQQALDELYEIQQADQAGQVILIVDRLDRAAAMQRLLDSPVVDHFRYPWLSVLVVARREAFNRWPLALRQQVARRGFRERYIRRLWQDDFNLKRELRRLMLLDSSVGDFEYQRRLRLWLAHLTYEARGSMALAIRKLKAGQDWFKEGGRLYLDPDVPYTRDRESIEHNAFVQKILEENWPNIVASLFNSAVKADQARIGVYYVIDWMRQHPIFDQQKLAAAAANNPIIIADDPELRAEVLWNLLLVLTENHYLDHSQDGKYRLAWQQQPPPFMQRVLRQMGRGGAGSKLKPDSVTLAQAVEEIGDTAPVSDAAPPIDHVSPVEAGTGPTLNQPKTEEGAKVRRAGSQRLQIALLTDLDSPDLEADSLVSQVAFEILEAKHRLILVDLPDAGGTLRQELSAYCSLYPQDIRPRSRPVLLISNGGESDGSEYEQVVQSANSLKELLDQADAIILAQRDDLAGSLFAPENVASRARGEGIPLFPVGAVGGITAELWREASNAVTARYQNRISAEDFSQLNPPEIYVPDIARAVVALVEQVCLPQQETE